MRRTFLAAAIIPALAFAAVTLGATKEAAAGPTVDLDLNLGTAFQTGVGQSAVDFSLGGGIDIGYRFYIPGSYLYLQPEIGGHYMRFGFNSDQVGYDYVGTLNAGAKLGLMGAGGVIQPNIFGHLGLGFLGRQLGPDTAEFGVGPALDIGAGLDIRVVPGFTLGAQIAYNSAADPSYAGADWAKWLSFGIKAGFQFGEPRPRPVYVRRVYY